MKTRLLITVLLISTFWSCEDYLDQVPENDIMSINTIFERRNTALTFLKSCYTPIFPSIGDFRYDPSICGADEYVANNFCRDASNTPYYIRSFQIASGLQHPSNPISNDWENMFKVDPNSGNVSVALNGKYVGINYCNTFIKNIDKVYDMTDKEKAEWKAQAKALKGFIYFELIKKYGPIVLIDENIPVEAGNDEMRRYRQHVDTCFNEVIRLFDDALKNIRYFGQQESSFYGFLCKEAVYALKARVLLYQASALFNGNSWYNDFTNQEREKLFSSAYDVEKWKKAAIAAEKAISECEGRGFCLINDSESDNEIKKAIENTKQSVLAVGYDSKELIWGIWPDDYNYSTYYYGLSCRLPRYRPNDDMFNDAIKGNLSPSMRMVELFYTQNGLPLTYDRDWNYADRYFLGKETNPKYKDIVSLGTSTCNLHLKREPRFYSNIAADRCCWKRNDQYVVMEAYRNERHGTYNKTISTNSAQNITGYWVKKGISDLVIGGPSFNYQQNRSPWPVVRMADLYLMKAEAWNEYEGPSDKVYNAINKIRERAGIPTVQKSWSEYSNVPDYYKQKDGLREIIRTERLIEFAFEGHRFWDMRRWKTAHKYMNKPIRGWNILGENAESFYNNNRGPIEVWTKNKFESPRDYFWPIRDQEIIKSGFKQNMYW